MRPKAWHLTASKNAASAHGSLTLERTVDASATVNVGLMPGSSAKISRSIRRSQGQAQSARDLPAMSLHPSLFKNFGIQLKGESRNEEETISTGNSVLSRRAATCCLR